MLLFNKFYLVLLLTFLSACNNIDSSPSLPDSSGKIDEVIVIMDENDWKDELGETFRDIIAEPYPGLPQGEPTFDFRQINFKAFQGLFKRSSTIVFVSPTDCDSEFCNHVKEAFSHYEKQGNDFLISFRDVYATPQKIIYISAPNKQTLVSAIIEGKDRIIKAISEVESKKAYNNAYASRTNKGYTELVKQKCGIDCPIPNSYKLVVDEDSLLWFRQDVEQAVSNIVFHVKQPESIENSVKHYGIELRNEYGKQYVQSDTEGSFMISDTLLPPNVKTVNINNKIFTETRGLWYLTEDFMGGPYINYTLVDKQNKKVVMMDGWIYAPQWKKRPQIRRIEQIFLNAKI